MKAPTVKRASSVKSITPRSVSPKSVTPEPRIRSRVGHWILSTVATAAAIGLGGTLCAQEPPQEPLVIPPIEELPIPDSPATAEPTASQPSPVRPGLPSQPDAVNGKQAAPLQLAPPAGKPKAPIVITPRKPVPTVKPAPVPADGVFSNGASNSVPNIPLPTSNQAVGGGGYLGLVAEPLQGGGFGLNVVDVTSQSPAWKAEIGRAHV